MNKKNELKGIFIMLGGMLVILGVGGMLMSYMEMMESLNQNDYNKLQMLSGMFVFIGIVGVVIGLRKS